jgi:hypothetical protein
MKAFLAAATALSLAVPAFAQGAGGVILTNPEFEGGFANRGQCESALAKVRNDQRKNPDKRGEAYRDLSSSDFQKASLRTTRCEEINGRYRVVFYVNGFPA